MGVDETALLGEPRGVPLEGEDLDRRTLEISSKLRCPICQGLSVADSPTPSALSMLDQVRSLLSRGYTEEQIVDYFVAAYGEFVLLEPKAEGFNLVVWIGPVVALILGIGILVWRVRGRSPETVGAADESLDPYLEQIRAELAPRGSHAGAAEEAATE